MTGKYKIEIYNNRVHFLLEIKRNITIIQGDSATGKTTLIGLISDHQRLGAGSGVTLLCDKPCVTLSAVDWQRYLQETHDHIIFMDENMPFIKTKEFAEAVNRSDNYFVIMYRDSLPQLAYSVEEIYGFHEDRESQKYISAKRVYNELYKIYDLPVVKEVSPDRVITEDSNAGHSFFSEVFSCPCVSAGGKANIKNTIQEADKAGSITLVIADGAAFGADMQGYQRAARGAEGKVILYAPESFEYLLLKSGIVEVAGKMLEHTYDYADSARYASWEQFYTELLTDFTRNTVYQYSKQKLNGAFLTEGNKKKILDVIPEILVKRD